MRKNKNNTGIAIVALIIAVIVILIFIMVVIVEIHRGIIVHANQYVTEIEKEATNGEKLKNELVQEYEEYL